MIVWNYRKLFSIEFLHDAYRDQADVLRSVRIVPDAGTDRLMSDYRLFCRVDRNFFYCYTQTMAYVDTTGPSPAIVTREQPLVAFDENEQLTFRLEADAAGFIDSSNLHRYDFRHNVFGLVNSTGNAAGTATYLSQAVPLYAAATRYGIGMYVRDGGTIYRAVKEISNVGPHPALTDPDYWEDITAATRFLNQTDIARGTDGQDGFGKITISFRKDAANEFALLKTSTTPAEDNKVIGRNFIAHFKNDAV